MRNRIIAMCLMLSMLFALLPQVILNVDAAETVRSGKCGNDLEWTLDTSGTLTISGTGPMSDYGHTDREYTVAPWYEYEEMNKINNIVVENGVTSIGNNAFLGCFGEC